ncbi:MAG: acyltransferase family protein [Verrucomicrobiales bacterium]|nr:acyltransferase family protein [Verrucomicrobiales bacterium]
MIPVIQLLRCFAVLVVFVYHLNPGFASGGYLGVDIFFVISGFVITRSIIAKLDQGRFQVSDFFVRRAFRILPPLLLVLVLVAVVALLFAGPVRYQQIFGSLPWSFAQVSNLYFGRSSDYFAMDETLNPLLHTWSLGVEEQFYAFFPFLLILLYRVKSLKENRAVVLGFALLASLVVSHLVYRWYGANWDFFLPVSRFWEFLLGAVLSVVRLPELGGLMRKTVLLSGWLILALACFGFEESFVEEDLLVLFPLLAVGIVLSQSLNSPFSNKFWKPFLFIGDISYSLYLWHWPVICLFKAVGGFGIESVALEYLLVVLTTFLFSSLQYRYFELPLRDFGRRPRKSFRGRVNVLARVLGICLLFGGISFALKSESDSGWRVVEDSRNPGEAALKRFEKEGLVEVVRSSGGEGFDAAIEQIEKAGFNALLIGDSHAEHYWPAVEAFCGERELKLGGLFGDGFWSASARDRFNYSASGRLLGKHGQRNDSRITEWLWDFVVVDPSVSTVFFAQNTNFYINGGISDGSPTGHLSFDVAIPEKEVAIEVNRALYRKDFSDLVSRMVAGGKKVILLGQVPQLDGSPRVVFGHLPKGRSWFVNETDDEEEDLQRVDFLPGLQQRFAFERKLYADFAERFENVFFFDSHVLIQSPYDQDGEVLYFDDDHLNEKGSRWITPGLKEFLQDELER